MILLKGGRMRELKRSRGKKPPDFFSFYLTRKFKKEDTKFLSVKQLHEELEKKGHITSNTSVRAALKRYKAPSTPSRVDGRLSEIYKTTDLENCFRDALESWEAKGEQN